MAISVLSSPVFREIGSKIFDRIVTHLIAESYITTDGEMVMLGQEAERVFGRSNWKELYSVVSGGGEYRAITPDGEVVGKLDARFVNSKDPGEISLGGRTWSMVKCDEGHNLVVVVPSGSDTSRIFWTGSGEGGLSPLVCRMVQEICKRGGSILPLADHDRSLLHAAMMRVPEGVVQDRLYVLERPGATGVEVLIFSLNGSRFNRVMALLLEDQLGGKMQARYNDFVIKVTRAGKAGAWEHIASAVRAIQVMGWDDIASILPLPPTETWKFARALPWPLVCELALSDYYHVEEFMAVIGKLNVSVLENTPVCAPPPLE